MIFKDLVLSGIYYLSGSGINKGCRWLLLYITDLVIRVRSSRISVSLVNSILLNRYFGLIKLIILRPIKAIQRVILGVSVPLVDLREDLVQDRHDFLI